MLPHRYAYQPPAPRVLNECVQLYTVQHAIFHTIQGDLKMYGNVDMIAKISKHLKSYQMTNSFMKKTPFYLIFV